MIKSKQQNPVRISVEPATTIILWESCTYKFSKIYWKTPVLKYLL